MTDPNLDAARADLQRLAADLETIGVAHAADLAALTATLEQVRAMHTVTRAELVAALARIAQLEAELAQRDGTRFGVNLANPFAAARLDVARVYFPPGAFSLTRPQPTWQGKAECGEAYALGCRDFIVSVKDHAWPDRLAAFLATVPADVTVWGCFFHEHEGNIRAGEFTADQYRERFAAVGEVFHAAGHKVGPIHNGLNLVDGRWKWAGYVEPDLGLCDYWGLDCYDPNGKGVGVLFDQWLPYAKSLGLPIVVGETGAPSGPAQAAWAADMRDWCQTNGIRLAAWWHQQFAGRPDYRMTPETQTVWLEARP